MDKFGVEAAVEENEGAKHENTGDRGKEVSIELGEYTVASEEIGLGAWNDEQIGDPGSWMTGDACREEVVEMKRTGDPVAEVVHLRLIGSFTKVSWRKLVIEA